MADLLAVVLPVFLVIGIGYGARAKSWIKDEAIDGLMLFAQSFAIPLLLFRAVSQLDLGAEFNAPLLVSFYTGAVVSFAAGIAGARMLFDRPWEDSVAIGFCCLFSNSLLLGLPITERAYGSDALAANYAIISIHAAVCYAIGITTMEIIRARGGSAMDIARKVWRAMTHNALVLGVTAGFALNLSGFNLPGPVAEGVDLLTRAALPTALFGLGGVLWRYRPEGDMRTILMICAISLVLHPVTVYALAQAFDLSTSNLRSAVITAAMAPGINAYIFANLYGVAKRVAASAVLFGTAGSVLTSTFWLTILP